MSMLSLFFLLAAAFCTHVHASQAGREFVVAVPLSAEFTLNLESVDGTTSCDISFVGGVSNTILVTKVATPHTLEIAGEYRLQSEDTPSFHRVSVDCDADVTLTLESGVTTSAVLPVNTWSKHNIALSPKRLVIAGDDGTEITTPDGDTIILNKDQSVWISDGGEAKEVESSNPVLVLSVDPDPDAGVVYLFYTPPSDTWGKEHIDTKGGQYVIIGKDEETNCRTPDREMTVTNEGAAVDLTEAGVIECDSAVLVLEANEDDEIVAVVPSTSQFTNGAELQTPDTGEMYDLEITIPKDGANDELLINDEPYTPDNNTDTTDLGDKYVQIKKKVPAGKYRIKHKMPTVTFRAKVLDNNGDVVSSSPLRVAKLGDVPDEYTEPEANDGIDNDGDYAIDEELLNSKDDDGDGLIDEDTASNEYYGDVRHAKWPWSYTVLIIVIGVILLLILIAVCHYKCQTFHPDIKGPPEEEAMITSYDSRVANNTRYSLSGTWNGFTLTRR